MKTTNIYDLIGIIFILIFFAYLSFLFLKSALVKENITISRRNKFLEDYIEKLYQEIEKLDNKILYISDSQLYESENNNVCDNNK